MVLYRLVFYMVFINGMFVRIVIDEYNLILLLFRSDLLRDVERFLLT